MNLEKYNKCPNCQSIIDKALKLELLKATEIQCPYCLKSLKINESKAFIASLPLNVLFAVGLSMYTDMTKGWLLVSILIFLVATYIPVRTIEIMVTKLKVDEI